jgi:predicted acylesterase/phospholipase RssA
MATMALELLRSAKKVGYVFSGGSSRCAFQVGALETLAELGVAPALCIGVSAGSWNAAAVAAHNDHRLRYYWRAFVRMPHVDVRNLWHEHSPWNYRELHRRTFARYVGLDRLRRADALPLLVAVTRLRDLESVVLDVRSAGDPLALLLASNYLPPFYTHPPRLDGERFGDGALTDNAPYERAFEEGCDAVVLLHMRGESEGGIGRSPRDFDHVIPPGYAARTVVIRPRHRLPVGFTERRWPELRAVMEIGLLRAREILLGEEHPETHVRGNGRSPVELAHRVLKRWPAARGGSRPRARPRGRRREVGPV